jgi:hypothetical protein
MHLLTLIKIAHLMGLVMGLGGALLLDFTILTRGIVRPVGRFTLEQLHLLSKAVSIGLALLWVTGAALIWLNLQDKPNYLDNPKLWAKIIVVIILTLNGMIIHGYIMPFMERRVGKRLFDGLANKVVAAFTLVAGISVVSWFTPFVLGKASELNFVTPMAVILGIYFLAVFFAWGGLLLVMSAVTTIQEQARDYEASLVQPEADIFNRRARQALDLVPVGSHHLQAAE